MTNFIFNESVGFDDSNPTWVNCKIKCLFQPKYKVHHKSLKTKTH